MALDSELWVRTHHAGERLQPLGMNGHSRKIQDMLTDAKIPAPSRRLWPIVANEVTCHLVAGRTARPARGRVGNDSSRCAAR